MWKFFKDFFIYGFASVFGKIAAVLLMPVYTSILTKEEYGAMAMLISVKGLIDLFSNLNIHSGIARDYYEKGVDRTSLISTGMWSILTLSCLIMIIMLFTKDYWTETVLGLFGYNHSFVLLLLTIPAGSLMSYFSILTRFKKKPLLFSTGTILNVILQLSVAIYTIVVLRMGISGFFLATFIAELFSICFFAFINREYISVKFNWMYLKKALTFSIPMLPAILAGWLDSSFGQILMGRYVSLADLGVYSIALQLASVFTLIGTALNNVWSPFLYENFKYKEFQVEVERLYSVFVFLLCFVSCTLSLFSKEIILLLSNPNYQNASAYLTLLCVPMSFYLLFPMASSGISISRDTKYIGISYVMGSVFNLLFLFLFLPKMGVFTVPVGLGLSRVITYSYMSYITKKKGLLELPNKILLSLVFIVAICFLIVYHQMDFVYRIVTMLILNGLLWYWANRKLQLKRIIINAWNNKINKR